MAQHHEQGVLSCSRLTGEQLREAEQLAELCNRLEGLDLPLDFEPVEVGSGAQAGQFLYYERGSLVGFASLEGITDPELCGMVHPDHRRKGIGRALLAAALEECRSRGLRSLVLACDQACPAGSAFASAVGARYLDSEYRMLLDPRSVDRSRPRHDGLVMRQASAQDAGAIARIVAAAEGVREDAAGRSVERRMRDPNQRYFISALQSEPVGTLRVSRHDPSVYIATFAVLPAHQGRGYGRQMLLDTVDLLLAERRDNIRIEVETDNHNAPSLYRSCGFRETSTYDYYLIEWAH